MTIYYLGDLGDSSLRRFKISDEIGSGSPYTVNILNLFDKSEFACVEAILTKINRRLRSVFLILKGPA